jgi:hypothetical protein
LDGFVGVDGSFRKYGIRAKTYFKLLDHHLWIFKDDKAHHAATYIDLKDATDVTPTGGPNMRLNMKDGSHYMFKAHSQEDFKQWGSSLNQVIKNANAGVPEKKQIEVFFMDKSNLPVVIDPKKTTAEDVRRVVPFAGVWWWRLTLVGKLLVMVASM